MPPVLAERCAQPAQTDPKTKRGAAAEAFIMAAALLRGRWRELREKGRIAPVAAQLAGETGWGVVGVLLLASANGASGFGRLAVQAGMGFWGAWIVAAAITAWDGGWHFPLRRWCLRPGYWIAYGVAVVLAPTGWLILGGFLPALLAIMEGLRVHWVRVPLVAVALALLVLCTLRITSLVRALTQARASVRASGFALAFGLAAWNYFGRGIPPLRWLARAATAPAPSAVMAVIGLACLLVALAAVDGWFARWSLLAGRPVRRRSSAGGRALTSGKGTRAALRAWPLLAWVRQWHILVASAALALALPVVFLFVGGGLGVGMPIAFSAFALFLQYSPRANLLGIDGAGAWRYAASGIAPPEVLAQRGRVLNVLAAFYAVPTIVLGVAERPSGWEGVAALIAFVVGTIALCDAGGIAASRLSPVPDQPEEALTGAMFWFCGCQSVWSIAFVIAFAATYGSAAARYWPAAVALLCLLVRAVVVRRERRRLPAWTAHILTELGSVIS